MKWIKSNGTRLEVRDCGPVLIALRSQGVEVLPIINEIMSDEEARARLRQLLDTGRYHRMDP